MANIGEFHPTLEDKSLVTDAHKEYAEAARATYKRREDIPYTPLDVYHDEISGSSVKTFVVEPNPAIALDERQGLMVTGNPFGNADRWTMRLRAQLIADVTGLKVMGFPNNGLGEHLRYQQNEYLSRVTKADMGGEMGYRALALVRTQAVLDYRKESGEEDDSPVFAAGWSESGTFAGAFGAVASEDVRIPAVGAYSTANIMDRTVPRLFADFVKGGGDEDYIAAARRTGIGALLNDDPAITSVFYRKVLQEPKYTFDLRRGSNLLKAKELRKPTLEGHLAKLLQNQPDAYANVVIGREDTIGQYEYAQPIADRLQRQYGRVAFLALENSGHGQGDSLFDLAVITSHTVNRAA